MSETGRTLAFAGVAAVLLIGAILAEPKYTPPEELTEQGPFYGNFTDPTKAASLQVVDYDEATGSATIFKVELKDGTYVIPSHNDYPADAADRLEETAALAVGLQKDVFRSSRDKDHEELGVIDPLDQENTSLKGRGKRVTLWDAGGQVLADYIFGKEAGEGKRFVRVPDENRTYAVRIKGEITAKFEDWIETDLLKVSQYAIRGLDIDHYTMEVQQRAFQAPTVNIKDRKKFALARKTSSDPWTMEGVKETEEVNEETVTSMLGALDDLKIVHVRKKPEGMTRNLQASGDFTFEAKLTPQLQEAIQSLAEKGYYFVGMKDEKTGEVVPQLLSGKGQLEATCDDGIVYTLRFGESRVATGASGAPKEGENKEEGGSATADAAQRYLFVTARFEESALGEAPAKPVPPEGFVPDDKKEKKDGADAPKQEESEEVKKYREALAEFERKTKDREKKIEDGKKRAKMLTDRFADWYYVISADLFNKLQVDRAKLVKPREKKEEDDGHGHPPHEKK